MFYDDDIIL